MNLARMLSGEEPTVPPPTTMIGALYRHLREADPRHFQPMNANFGLVEALGMEVRDKKRKKELVAERALAGMVSWRDSPGRLVAPQAVLSQP
jgi:methylenetetrahydrofolate--tRNA-(uracil-5-)-methyltransferase